ncbi:DUF1294 domain-containing protein [Paenibacillus sp. y28]
MIINFVAYMLMGSDKSRAQRRERRVPEKHLFALAAAGGSLGVWLAMRHYRHKTKHASFVFGIPLIVLVQAALVALLIGKL